MVEVIFYGDMAKEFGQSRKLFVSSFKEIFKALEANGGKLRKYLMAKDKRKIYYRIFVDDAPISSLMEMDRKFDKKKNSIIKIIPVPMGQVGSLGGRGISYLSLGLGALFLAGGAALLASGVGSAIAVPLIFAGITLLATGVIGLLSPQPKFQPDQAQGTSFLFDGILETAREGLPVPVVYGRLLVQGITVNSVINTIDTDGTGTGYSACGSSAQSIIVNYALSSQVGSVTNSPSTSFNYQESLPYNITISSATSNGSNTTSFQIASNSVNTIPVAVNLTATNLTNLSNNVRLELYIESTTLNSGIQMFIGTYSGGGIHYASLSPHQTTGFNQTINIPSGFTLHYFYQIFNSNSSGSMSAQFSAQNL